MKRMGEFAITRITPNKRSKTTLNRSFVQFGNLAFSLSLTPPVQAYKGPNAKREKETLNS